MQNQAKKKSTCTKPKKARAPSREKRVHQADKNYVQQAEKSACTKPLKTRAPSWKKRVDQAKKSHALNLN